MNEKQNAIIRELREMAKDLPRGKARKINNYLDYVSMTLRRNTPKVENAMTAADVAGENERLASQAKTIYAYLVAGNTITSDDARRLFGVARLASRICDIERQTGVTPSRRRIPVKNRYGKDVWVNEYWIDREGN